MADDSLDNRLRTLENRLDIIERRLGLEIQKPAVFPERKTVPDASQTHIQLEKRTSQSFYKPDYKPEPREETTFGASKLLGIVGIICFVLASAFLIKLAVDSGWLTPERQLGLAALFGFTLIGVGLWFQAKDITYASLLPGAGIVILNMCAYAGNNYYHFYQATMSATLATLTSCLSLYLYKVFRNAFYVVVAVIGSYMSVFLFPAEPSSLMSVMGFFIIWDVGFSILSILFSSRVTTLIAAYLALGGFFVSAAGFIAGNSRDVLLTVLIFQAIQFFIFVCAVGFYSVQKKKPMADGESWAYFPLLLFFYGLEYFIISKLYPENAPFIAMGFAAVIYGIYFLFKSKVSRTLTESQGVFNSFAIIVFFHAFYLEFLPEHYTPYFAILATLLMLGLYRSKKSSSFRLDHLILALVFFDIFVLNYMKILWESGNHFGLNEIIILNAIFFGVLFFGYIFINDKKTSLIDKNSEIILLIAHVQALTALWRISHRLTENSHFASVTGFMTSILWALFAIIILFISKTTKDKTLSNSALAIFAFAIGKVLLFDVASASPIARVICFLILGIVFYAGGYLYRYVDNWTKSENKTS